MANVKGFLNRQFQGIRQTRENLLVDTSKFLFETKNCSFIRYCITRNIRWYFLSRFRVCKLLRVDKHSRIRS